MSMQKRNTDFHSTETATVFPVAGEPVVGVMHNGNPSVKTGIVFVVGGRQYRIGAQRQFLRLARSLAAEGYSVFRFDLRGMGDSAAQPVHFLETAPDLSAAIEEFRRIAPWLESIVLWGICDGATASIIYAAEHRVSGVIMVNPWVTTEVGAARAMLKHHYSKRFVSVNFWRRLILGEINIIKSVRSLQSEVARGHWRLGSPTKQKTDFPEVVFAAIERFNGSVAFIISKKDLTALEFKEELDKRYPNLQSRLPKARFFHIDADHTFSSLEQHTILDKLTLDWCRELLD